MKILVMGLPGSGKTTFAERLQPLLNAVWINANKVRNKVCNRNTSYKLLLLTY